MGAREPFIFQTPTAALSLLADLTPSSNVQYVEYPVPSSLFPQLDYVINCTTVGFDSWSTIDNRNYLLQPYSPLCGIDSEPYIENENGGKRGSYMKHARPGIVRSLEKTMRIVENMKASAKVIDIIYQPEKTILLTVSEWYGLSTLNGISMNLEQAVLAFLKVTKPDCSADLIHKIMSR